MRKWKPGGLRLAGERNRDDRSRALVEHIVAENKNRTQASLFATANGVKVSPANFAPQYAGHDSSSLPRPSSARAFSNFGSSLAHSDARRPRSMRKSFSLTAACIARLRL